MIIPHRGTAAFFTKMSISIFLSYIDVNRKLEISFKIVFHFQTEMSSSQLQPPVRLLRSIMRELRRSRPEGSRLRGSQSSDFVLGLFRKNAVTQEQVCKHREEMAFMADTYSTYLTAQREYEVVQQEYHAKGERSVDQTAKMVGFNLPHEAKVERRVKPSDPQ